MFIENPSEDMRLKWGPLAYVTEDERNSILNSSYGQFKPAIKQLEKRIKELAKTKKRQESEYKQLHRFVPESVFKK